jgi:hypothetical protein
MLAKNALKSKSEGAEGRDGWGMKPNKKRFEGKPAEAKKF